MNFAFQHLVGCGRKISVSQLLVEFSNRILLSNTGWDSAERFLFPNSWWNLAIEIPLDFFLSFFFCSPSVMWGLAIEFSLSFLFFCFPSAMWDLTIEFCWIFFSLFFLNTPHSIFHIFDLSILTFLFYFKNPIKCQPLPRTE